MPGRAGRSKGCINCQRRKLGCDRATPSCGRCTRLGEACKGYASASFIAFEPPKARKALKSRPNPPVEKDSQVILAKNGPSVPEHIDLFVVPSMLPMTQDIFIAYTKCYMFRGTGDHFPVLNLMDPTTSSNVLYRAAVTALSTSFYGLSQGRTEILQKGTRLYGRSLQDVNYALAHKASVASADLLSSIVCLGMFEFLHPTSLDGWKHHFNGLSRLFEMWGPVACSTYPIRRFLEHCRPIMIFASLGTQRPSFLAHPDWKTIPWQGRDVHKAPIELLFDIMADLPALACEYGRIRSVFGAESAVRNALILEHRRKVQSTLKELDQWLASFIQIYPDYRTESPCSSIPMNSEGQQLSWRSDYHYRALGIANAICFHDATRIFVLLMLISGPGGESEEEEKKLSYIEAVKTSAFDICKSTDFHFLHIQGRAGGFFLMFPMMMTMRAFVYLQMWPEVRWTRDQFEIIGSKNSVAWQIAGHWSRHSYVKS